MDIAALSSQMSMVKVQNGVSIALMKKTMDQQQVNMENMVDMIEAATPAPPSEHMIDIKV